MAADPAVVAAAQEFLARLGVSVADLRDPDRFSSSLPTLAEYLPRVVAAAGPGARRTYGSYWARMMVVWGTWPLDAIAASDVEALQRQLTATARYRRTTRGGRHAGEHVVAAARAVFNRAIADGLLARARVRRIGSVSRAGYRPRGGR